MTPPPRPSCSDQEHQGSCSCTRTPGRCRSEWRPVAPAARWWPAVAFRCRRSSPDSTHSRPRRHIDMGLIGGIARTAVIAGTATAVGNRVSRRQGNRWAQQDQAQYEQQQQQYAQPVYAAPPPAPAPAADDVGAQLEKLAQLHSSGVLTDEEFAAGKAKILGI